MCIPDNDDFKQVPGLYRLWDLQFLLNREDIFQVSYVEQTADGTALFAVWRRMDGKP